MATTAPVTTGPAQSGSESPLSFAIGIVAAATIMIFLYAAILGDLASEWWTEPSASHGLLIPPLVLWIVWQRRNLTLMHPAVADARGLVLMFMGCAALIIGKLAAEFFLTRISFVIVVAGLTWTFQGPARFKTLLFPFVLLATMVPLPALVFNLIAAPLQLFASAVSTSLAQTLGVSIYRDGNIIHLANTSLGVAEACSGLHSLSAMVVASLLLGFLEAASVTGRAFLFLISIPLAIAVNVIRVTGTALIADYRLELAEGYYHAFSGWLVFVVGFVMLWLLSKPLFRLTRRLP